MAAYLLLKWQLDKMENEKQFEDTLKRNVVRIVVYRDDYYYVIYKNNGNKYEFNNIYHNFFMNLVNEYDIDNNIIIYKEKNKTKRQDDCQCIIS